MGTLGITCKGLLYLLNGLLERVTGSLLTPREQNASWAGWTPVLAAGPVLEWTGRALSHLQAPGNQAYVMAPDSEGLLPGLGGALTAPWPWQEPALRASVLPHGSASHGQAQLMLLQEACRSAVPGLGDTAGGMAVPSRHLPGAPHLQPRCSPWRGPWPSSGASTSAPQPPVPPGQASTTEPLMGATTTSWAAAPTCWQELLTPPGLSTSHPGDIAPSLGTASW
ncbi:Aminopeptidase Q [Manis pentadactyla]|nr:Aminopeptidase Q [Manis pentadactyla]